MVFVLLNFRGGFCLRNFCCHTDFTWCGLKYFELKMLRHRGATFLPLKWLPQMLSTTQKSFSLVCFFFYCSWAHQLLKKRWSCYLLLIDGGCCVISLLLSGVTLSCYSAHGASSLRLSHGISCSSTGGGLRLGCSGCL